MKLIFGLGNPDQEYAKTRHNIGFMVLDELAQDQKWNDSKKAMAQYLKTVINNQPVELLKPQTYMNRSGLSVAHAMRHHNLQPDDLIVIHDDKDLPLGKIKVQANVSSAGHNGVQSIIDNLKTKNFTRIRIGIASDNPKKMSDTGKFVLGRFGWLEKTKVKKIIASTIEKIEELVGQ